MDHFSLYDIPRSFYPDPARVKKQYLQLSRAYHPDRFAGAMPSEQENALRMSAMNNNAYKTLTDRDRLIPYVLQLEGVWEEEEKYTLPPAFLMEMMELNELLDDATTDATAKVKATSALAEATAAWETETSPLLQAYSSGDTVLLGKIKDAWARWKYLLRIKNRLDTFATTT